MPHVRNTQFFRRLSSFWRALLIFQNSRDMARCKITGRHYSQRKKPSKKRNSPSKKLVNRKKRAPIEAVPPTLNARTGSGGGVLAVFCDSDTETVAFDPDLMPETDSDADEDGDTDKAKSAGMATRRTATVLRYEQAYVAKTGYVRV